jgi:hypothetical protein
MKNDTQKRIRVYLKSLGESVNYERLFRALSLILSEEDLVEYFSVNRNLEEYCSNFDERSKESEVLAENIANS